MAVRAKATNSGVVATASAATVPARRSRRRAANQPTRATVAHAESSAGRRTASSWGPSSRIDPAISAKNRNGLSR
jgi:hypothetical protein